MLQEGHFAIVSGEEGVAAVQDLVTADPVVAQESVARLERKRWKPGPP